MKNKINTNTIFNKRASYDYVLSDNLVVGIALSGKEVRSFRDNRVQIKSAFVTIRNHELWLNNSSFTVKNNEPGSEQNTVSTEPRKLLATKKQIAEFERKKVDGFSIVPVKMFTAGKLIKVEIALGKGKKSYDKRESIKKRDIERHNKRFLR